MGSKRPLAISPSSLALNTGLKPRRHEGLEKLGIGCCDEGLRNLIIPVVLHTSMFRKERTGKVCSRFEKASEAVERHPLP